MWSYTVQGHRVAAQTTLMQAQVKHHNVGSRAPVITDARPITFKDEFHSSEICWQLSLRAMQIIINYKIRPEHVIGSIVRHENEGYLLG